MRLVSLPCRRAPLLTNIRKAPQKQGCELLKHRVRTEPSQSARSTDVVFLLAPKPQSPMLGHRLCTYVSADILTCTWAPRSLSALSAAPERLSRHRRKLMTRTVLSRYLALVQLGVHLHD
jgi:hypothetical protein